MKRRFELFMLWLIERAAKLFKTLFEATFTVLLYTLPIYVLVSDEGELAKGFCLFWVIVLYPATIFTLIHIYHEYLRRKYRKEND